MYNIEHLKTFNLSGTDYFIEVDAMNSVHFFPKNSSKDNVKRNKTLHEIEKSLDFITNDFIDKSVQCNLSVNNKYFSFSHHHYSDLKISFFNKKEKGKLSSISLLFINNQRFLIFNTEDKDRIIDHISLFITQSKICNINTLQLKLKKINKLLRRYSI